MHLYLMTQINVHSVWKYYEFHFWLVCSSYTARFVIWNFPAISKNSLVIIRRHNTSATAIYKAHKYFSIIYNWYYLLGNVYQILVMTFTWFFFLHLIHTTKQWCRLSIIPNYTEEKTKAYKALLSYPKCMQLGKRWDNTSKSIVDYLMWINELHCRESAYKIVSWFNVIISTINFQYHLLYTEQWIPNDVHILLSRTCKYVKL